MTHKLYFRPENGSEGRIGRVYGPFEYLQLVYNSLTISPNGDEAMFIDKGGKWRFSSENIEVGLGLGVRAHPDDAGKDWTDIVIMESSENEKAITPIVDQTVAERTPESVMSDHLPMTYNNIVEWLARDVLGSTEETDQIEANVDHYVEDLTSSIQEKAEEIGV